MGLLSGKVAIVTGSGQGIGRAHALHLARAGANLVINDPGCDRSGEGGEPLAERVAEEVRAIGVRACSMQTAVGSAAAAQTLVDATIAEFGRLDILVNNAGILRDRTILKMTEDEWDAVVQVHLRGSFTCLQAVARFLKQQGEGGQIINTSSYSGLLGNFGQANYGAAKAGIHALTRIAAMELSRYQIRVNAIAPLAYTRMTDDLPKADTLERDPTMSPDFIAPLVVYLASDLAADVTGQTFGVEGNRLFTYRMMTSHGSSRFVDDGPWTPDEIAENIQQIIDW